LDDEPSIRHVIKSKYLIQDSEISFLDIVGEAVEARLYLFFVLLGCDVLGVLILVCA